MSDNAKEWKRANPDKVKDYRKRYYQLHKDRTKREAIKYQKANLDETSLRWRAASANQRYPGRFGIADMRALVERDGRRCCWCGKENLEGHELTLEHLQPFNRLDCVTIACMPCNAGHAGEHGGRIQTPEERKAKADARIKQWRIDNVERYKQGRREYLRKYRAKKKAEKLNGKENR